MFENAPLVELALGRSTVRQRILALLMDESVGRLHLREIQRRSATSPGTASRELAKLVAAGLVEREAEGNQVYFRASDTPFAAMLRTLLVAMPAPEFKSRPDRMPRQKRSPSDVPAAANPDLGGGAGETQRTDGAPRLVVPAPAASPKPIGPAGTRDRAVAPESPAGQSVDSAGSSAASTLSGKLAGTEPADPTIAAKVERVVALVAAR